MADDHKARNHHDRSDVHPPLPAGEAGARVRRRVEEDAGGVSRGIWGRTSLFLLGGAGMLLLGFLAQPRYQSREVKPEAERILFPELTDVQKAASLEVVKYDEELATLQPFKVVQAGGVWVLPSHQNYPADARDHLAAAATELVDLESLDVVSSSAADHETYGVIEPDPEKIKPGMVGVGELIEIRDAGGNKLARLVVGKEDKRPGTSAAGGKKLRFVRKAGQDPVYRVEIDTSKFTTRFDDWIEKDLLKLSPWDVRRAILDDYSLGAVESGGRIRVEQNRKDRIEVAYDDKAQQWTLARLEAFGGGAEAKLETLGEAEELASPRLNDLRNALGDLKIVDVVRKPAGLSAELKAEEKFTADEEAVRSMQQRGFLPLKSGDILSTDGETIVGMKDGVEYVLRFGAATTVAAEAAKGDGAKDAAGETSGRYLLVMARFNEGLLEKPQLDPLPDLPSGEGKKSDEKPAAEKAGVQDGAPKDGAPKDGAPKDGAPKDGAAKPEAAPGPTGAQGGKSDGVPAGDGASGDAGAGGAAGTAGAAAVTEATANADDKKQPEAGAAAALKKADEDEAKAQAAIENRRRVERENRRKQDEYDDRVKAAQRRVRELNGRFADWYYVVPNKEYAKIHLGRSDAVQKVQAKDKPAAPAAE